MGEVIAFADIVLVRRRRMARELHARCVDVLATSVISARFALATAPAAERWVRVARLRKLEDLYAYASGLG